MSTTSHQCTVSGFVSYVAWKSITLSHKIFVTVCEKEWLMFLGAFFLRKLLFKAGGLGFIAAGHFQNVDKLEREIGIFSRNMQNTEDITCDGLNPCIGFIGHSSLSTSEGWTNYEYILKEHNPKAVQFFAPSVITRQMSCLM